MDVDRRVTLGVLAGLVVTQNLEATKALGAAPDQGAVAPNDRSIALILGGGAAKGLAHIPVLEAFDELGVRPRIIAGTSIGSIMGACYASGMSGSELRAYALELFETRRELVRRLFANTRVSLSSLFSLSSSALIRPEALLDIVLPDRLPEKFSELSIPLVVIATDFHSQSEVVIKDGPLLPAIAASSALPGLLAPVRLGEQLLIDGGFTNPTPFDVVRRMVQFTVAVDVTGKQTQDGTGVPNAFELIVGASQIAIRSVVMSKLTCSQPDVLIRPEIQAFNSLDFYQVVRILEAVAPVKEDTKRQLDRLLR